MNIDDTVHGISTLLEIETSENTILGTGFFYQELAEKDPTKKGFYWREVKETWVVTNRHIVLPIMEGNELVPNRITFNMRKIEGDGVIWEPIEVTGSEIKRRLKLHKDSMVDVSILRISDLITERLKKDKKYMAWSAVSEEDLPGNSSISAEVADDAIIIGYPRGYYDMKNIFPIVKSGIIASRWGLQFNGKPVFVIDAKLFPGSSGSIVITKPISSTVVDGPLKGSREAHFAFLGVYSGEPIIRQEPIDFDDFTITRKDTFNLGTVWYGKLVADIVKEGITQS